MRGPFSFAGRGFSFQKLLCLSAQEPVNRRGVGDCGQCALERKMEKKIAGLIGAVAAIGAATGVAQAAPAPAATDVLNANSFADLLEPVPNAATKLQALDEQTTDSAEPGVQLAQYYYHHHHHHHHHHHRYWRRGPVIVVPPRWHRHHHHHHHHHHGYYRY
jgi:hypothetical protein